MRKTYAEFCSGHLKAVKLYKELLARDKRLQYFIRVRAKWKKCIVMSLISHSTTFFLLFILHCINLFIRSGLVLQTCLFSYCSCFFKTVKTHKKKKVHLCICGQKGFSCWSILFNTEVNHVYTKAIKMPFIIKLLVYWLFRTHRLPHTCDRGVQCWKGGPNRKSSCGKQFPKTLHKTQTEITADQEIVSSINSVSIASSYVGMKQPHWVPFWWNSNLINDPLEARAQDSFIWICFSNICSVCIIHKNRIQFIFFMDFFFSLKSYIWKQKCTIYGIVNLIG